MSNIYKAFENKKAFIAFLTAGDPDYETSLANFRAVLDAGADLVEVGIPFQILSLRDLLFRRLTSELLVQE